MSTLLFIIAGIVLVIVIMAHLPGLEHFVKPIIGLLFTLLQAVLINGFAWGFFLIKIVWFSHLDLIKNLLLSEADLDPTLAVKEKSSQAQ